ncbi:kinase II subunit beta [Seminavis robusta]|uniref:Casein kinase II subunit beta n=1 Tax=Seminavis robusta TaxID=568900 RepID=A0A9N8ECQ5_9STRA|nr:kinase II subunit beta [Seminavis robusta]|eukprot:Sro762_g198690.1 kinase II subunit beta (655) ;mRNA; f:21847-23811
MTASPHCSKNSLCPSARKKTCDSNSRNHRQPWTRSVVVVTALLALQQSSTIASTSSQPRRNPHSSSHSTDEFSWQDYSSDNYHHLIQQQQQQQQNSLTDSNNRFSSLYLSDDEYEEQVLSALARADDRDLDQDDTDELLMDSSDWFSTSSSRRRPRQPRKTKKDQKQESDVGEEEEEDVFLTKLQRFKEALLHTSALNPTITPTTLQKETEEHTDATGQPDTNNLPPKKSQEMATLSSKKLETTRLGRDTGIKLVSNDSWNQVENQKPSTNQQLSSGGLVQVETNVRKESDSSFARPVQHFAADNKNNDNKPTLHQETTNHKTQPQQPPITKVRKHKPMRPAFVRAFSNNNQQPQEQSLQQKNSIIQPPSPPARASMMDNNNVSPWVRKFLSTRPKDCLLLVPRDYLVDNFNLARLAPVVEHLATLKQKQLEAPSPNLEQRTSSSLHQQQQQHQSTQKQHSYPIYRQALELILRQEGSNEEEPSSIVHYAAEILYCLVHARFVTTPRGLDTIRSRMIIHGSHSINQPLFGRCPRLGCRGMPLLPCGLSDDYDPDDQPQSSRAKRYCCNCQETFHFWDSKVQGCAWAGKSLCHLLLLVYGKKELFPSHFATDSTDNSADIRRTHADSGSKSRESDIGETGRIFGFPIHHDIVQDW